MSETYRPCAGCDEVGEGCRLAKCPAVTHMSHRDAPVTPLTRHAVSHVPQRSVPPTRPDPTRPISMAGVVCGCSNADQIQSGRHLGLVAAPIGIGEIR